MITPTNDLCGSTVSAVRQAIRDIAEQYGTTEATLEQWLSENMRARRYRLTWEAAGFRFRSLACAMEREGYNDASSVLLYGAGVISLADAEQSLDAAHKRRKESLRLMRETAPTVSAAPIIPPPPPKQAEEFVRAQC